MFATTVRRALAGAAALALLSGAAAAQGAVPPGCDDPALPGSLTTFVENIEEIKAAAMAVKEVRGFAEVSYDEAAQVRVCKAEAELANGQIIDLTITFNPKPEDPTMFIPKVDYVPRA
jgi:predicted outer membrane protein